MTDTITAPDGAQEDEMGANRRATRMNEAYRRGRGPAMQTAGSGAGAAAREFLAVAIMTPVGIVMLGGVMVAVEKLSPIIRGWF